MISHLHCQKVAPVVRCLPFRNEKHPSGPWLSQFSDDPSHFFYGWADPGNLPVPRVWESVYTGHFLFWLEANKSIVKLYFWLLFWNVSSGNSIRGSSRNKWIGMILKLSFLQRVMARNTSFWIWLFPDPFVKKVAKFWLSVSQYTFVAFIFAVPMRS